MIWQAFKGVFACRRRKLGSPANEGGFGERDCGVCLMSVLVMTLFALVYSLEELK